MKATLKNPIVILLFFLVTGITSCRTSREKSKEKQQLSEMEMITPAHGNNLFAFDIFNMVSKENDDNLVISPFSISTALAMTFAGARGETALEMARTLHFNTNQEKFHPAFHQWLTHIVEAGEKSEQLSLANSLWPQKDYHFIPEYFELIERYYNSALYEVDYKGDREAIRNQINQWVAERTNDLIKELIKPGVLIEDTRLVLVNAIYFLAQWQIAFDENNTRDGRFNLADGNTVVTPLMYMKDHFHYFESERFQMLEMLYTGEDFSMVVVLPADGKGVDGLLAEFSAEDFSEAVDSMQRQEVEVFLPTFRIRSDFELEKIMASMGMPLAFSNRADFGAMTSENDLKIDKIIHQAFIDVKEEGTEAAAATAVVMIRKSAVVDPTWKQFRADRPFLYFIRNNKDNSILFMGKVMNPSRKD